MTRARTFIAVLVAAACAGPMDGSEAIFDRIEEVLSGSAFRGQARARVSGLLDFEGYAAQQPAPALIERRATRLFTPRLTLFFDAQVGRSVYAFAQVRADRGFDPQSGDAASRLDEYALRVAPWADKPFHIQAGKFATIVGNWTARHSSWANPFVTAPLVYENLTGIWDSEALRSATTLLQWSHVRAGLPAGVTAIEKSLRVPVIWGPAYASGLAVTGDLGRWRLALEVKHAPLSSRPETWASTRDHWDYPTVGGRIGFRPNPMWNAGVSASAGPYLRPFADRSLAAGRGRGDYRQFVLAHDLSFAWHHFQAWAEIFASRFAIPGIDDVDTIAYYVETKYKLTPQWFASLRWNQQVYGSVHERGAPVKWGQDAWRIDAAAGYRLSAHMQVKLQYNFQHGDTGARDHGRLLAAQVTVRF